jgi:hypothetical protein
MRADPPPRQALAPSRSQDAAHFDRWVAARFTPEELQAIFRLELEYGEYALAEWYAEVAFEAGMSPSAAH